MWPLQGLSKQKKEAVGLNGYDGFNHALKERVESSLTDSA